MRLEFNMQETEIKPTCTISLAAQLHRSVNSQCFSLWEPSIFDPPQHRCPLTDRQKFITGYYVQDFYSCAKFGGNPFVGAAGQIGEI